MPVVPTTAAPAPAPSPAAPPPPAARSVDVQDYLFSPASISVPAGTTITWTNAGQSVHTVTADGGAFDTGMFAPGARFSHTFAGAGTFAYRCQIHPSMVASVVVG